MTQILQKINGIKKNSGGEVNLDEKKLKRQINPMQSVDIVWT